MNHDLIRHDKLHVNVTDNIPWRRAPLPEQGGTYTVIPLSVPYVFRAMSVVK